MPGVVSRGRGTDHLAHRLDHVAELDNLGIPESGDGKSDILQEAKWEADFLLKMQDNGTLGVAVPPDPPPQVVPGGFYTLVYPRTGEYEVDRVTALCN